MNAFVPVQVLLLDCTCPIVNPVDDVRYKLSAFCLVKNWVDVGVAIILLVGKEVLNEFVPVQALLLDGVV